MSYEKIVDGFKTPEERKKHEEMFGGYNDPLPNMQEITEKEFARSGFFSWCIEALEFRQIDCRKLKPGALLSSIEPYFSVKIFYLNGNTEDGFAIYSEYITQRIRYFKFGKCYHEYRELTMEESKIAGRHHFGMCYHIYKCNKCGFIWECDSSD